MQRDEQLRVIDGLIAHLDAGTNVDAGGHLHNPVTSYTCTDIASREWQTFFQQHPQLLGLSADLPEPGSFFTSNDLGKPILCTRDEAGGFRAFLNVCRHRGTVVESAARGTKTRFSCPFHAWTYASDGALVGVPKEGHFGTVDRACHSLVELPAEERHGLLWVSPDPDGALDLPAQLGELDAELASWSLTRYQRLDATCYPHAMNWKLAIDTFGETYHFNALHRDTLANDFHGNVQTYRTYLRNHRMALCLRNIDNVRHTPRADWHLLQAAIPVYYLFPNVQLIIGMNGPTLVRVYPDGDNPHQSRSQVSFYLDPRVAAADHPAQGVDPGARLRGFGNVIRDEDYVAAAASHVGARSGAQTYFTFGRNEPALHHYHNTYRTALGMAPLELHEA